MGELLKAQSVGTRVEFVKSNFFHFSYVGLYFKIDKNTTNKQNVQLSEIKILNNVNITMYYTFYPLCYIIVGYCLYIFILCIVLLVV